MSRSDVFDIVSSNTHKFKVVILGDLAVGKTSLVTKFMYNTFEASHHNTIGIDFLTKSIRLVNGRNVRLQLWDTAGQERFRSLIPSYIRDCSLAIVVFDLSARDSLASVKAWVDTVVVERGNTVRLFVVGNKADKERAVSDVEVASVVAQVGAVYVETSAKNGTNIQLLFDNVVETLMPKSAMVCMTDVVEIASSVTRLDETPRKHHSCSC